MPAPPPSKHNRLAASPSGAPRPSDGTDILQVLVVTTALSGPFTRRHDDIRLSGCNLAKKRRPQDGRIKRDQAGQEIEIRVSSMPTAPGEKQRTLKRGKGCLHCRQAGYTGRDGIFEVLPMSDAIRRTLRQAALERVLAGTRAVSEMVRVTGK